MGGNEFLTIPDAVGTAVLSLLDVNKSPLCMEGISGALFCETYAHITVENKGMVCDGDDTQVSAWVVCP